jgi:hypothetical protein
VHTIRRIRLFMLSSISNTKRHLTSSLVRKNKLRSLPRPEIPISGALIKPRVRPWASPYYLLLLFHFILFISPNVSTALSGSRSDMRRDRANAEGYPYMMLSQPSGGAHVSCRPFCPLQILRIKATLRTTLALAGEPIDPAMSSFTTSMSPQLQHLC